MEGGRRRCIATPAHILHLITFLKYDPASAKRFHAILVFPHPPGRGVSRFFAGEKRRGSKVCGPSTILYAKFHGSRKRNSESASKWSSPWKITRGISGPSFIHPYGHACSAPRFISSEQFIFPDYRVLDENFRWRPNLTRYVVVVENFWRIPDFYRGTGIVGWRVGRG